ASRARKIAEDEHIRERAALERRQDRLAAAIDDAAQAASLAGLEAAHRELFDQAALKQSRDALDGCIQNQIEKAEHAARLNEEVSRARSEIHRAGSERDQLSGLVNDARERLNKARREHEASVGLFLEAVSDWTADLAELPLPFDEAFLKSVREWCDE